MGRKRLWALAVAVGLIAGMLVGPAGANQVHTVCASGCDHATIQAAVDAAEPGDVVRVAAGDYAEGILLSKSLTLLGANAGVPAGATPGARGQESQVFGFANSGGSPRDVTIDGFAVRTPVQMNAVALRGGHLEVVNNVLVGQGSGSGIVTTAVSAGRFSGNTVRGFTTAVNLQGLSGAAVSRLEIAGNRVSSSRDGVILQPALAGGHVVQGNHLEGTGGVGRGVWVNQSGNTVHGNTVTGFGAAGVELSVSPGITANTVEANIFTGNGAAVVVSGTGDRAGNRAVANAFDGAGLGVANGGTSPFDATCNWWGSADGPGGEDAAAVTGPVLYDPWLLSPDGPCGPPEVKDDCKKGAWEGTGHRNQGQCVRSTN